MFLQQDSNFTLQARLADTVAVSQVELSVTYRDNTDSYHPDVTVATSNTTPVVLLEPPSNGVINLVELIKIFNPDTQAHKVQILAGNKVIYTCTIGADQSLIISEEGGNGLGYTPLAVDGDGSHLTGITTAQITDTENKRFTTDAEKSVLENTSGVNTGDETQSSIVSKLGFTPLSNADTTITKQGNTFNGVNELVKLDSNGKLPALDGSQLVNISRTSKYDSGWFLVTANMTYTKTHNLGTKDINYIVLIADDINGTNQRPAVDFCSNFANYDFGWRGGAVTETTLTIITAAYGVGIPTTSSSNITSGYYRVIAEKI